MNAGKSFISKNKGSIMNAATSALGGGAGGDFMKIAMKATTDPKGAAMDAAMLAASKVLPPQHRDLLEIAKKAMTDPKGAGMDAIVTLGKKVIPPEHHDIVEMVP